MDDDAPVVFIVIGIFVGGIAALAGVFAVADEPFEWKSRGTGEHVGIITAVQQTGDFWRTWTVFVKTDAESTQEETYCVRPANTDLIKPLQAAARGRYLVALQYESYWNVDWSECNPGEEAILSVSRV